MLRYLFIFLILFIAVFFLYFFWLFVRGKTSYVGGDTMVTIREMRYVVDIADTVALQAQGLSGRESLDADKGMLFIFPSSSERKFWMQGMNFAIDIVWINEGRVVGFAENVPAAHDGNKEVRESGGDADMVLEINAGEVARVGMQVGDEVMVTKK